MTTMSRTTTAEERAPRTGEASLGGHAEALHEALGELVRVYQFRDRDRICCHDVSVTQCYAIEALLRRGPSTLNDLAAQLYLDKSTASRVVAALERKRYVTRAPHPQDGRAVVLTVTPAGRRLHDGIRRELVEEAKHLLADVEPEVREEAARLVLRLARAAAARAGLGAAGACCPTPAEE
jgi:MarR family transcriptional regulator, 2-MHQ and catechol-resistance regulon repressor